MDFFSILTLIGGLALFLYGMNVMGDGLAKVSGGKMERILETLTSNPPESRRPGRCRNRSHPVIISNHRNGSWLRQFRHHETLSGSWRYHGCQYRYNNYILDSESFRNRK